MMVYISPIFFLVFIKEILSICEKSHVVVCDDLSDWKKNDTWTWRFVLIGSDQFQDEPPRHIFNLCDFNRVKSLTIINRLNLIKPGSTKCVIRLEYLNLYKNELKEIKDHAFADMPRLRDLFLKNNQIENLGNSVFKNTALEILSLSRNKLSSITTCFRGSSIEWLRLNHNKLTFIETGAFPKNLERLELDHNLLASLDAGVFRNLGNLKELSVRHNRLTAVPDISSLTRICYLHFSYNQIESVSYPFSLHEKLEFLDLNCNLIRDFDVETVSCNDAPPLVLLMFNRLTNLNFTNPSKKTDLGLLGNPFVCDCYSKIRKVVADYRHSTTCQVDFAKLPLCFDNGTCGEGNVTQSAIDNFVKAVNVFQNKDACVFRL